MAELEQAVVGGAERDRNHGRALDIEAVGHGPGGAGGYGAQLGVRTVAAGRRDSLPDLQVRHFGPDFNDLAARLVPDDVRARGERAAGAVERVAPLDRDRLDPNDDAFRMALGIRNVLVLQDLGTAVLV